MPTYIYEIIPKDEGTPPVRFEIQQRMIEDALVNTLKRANWCAG